MLAKGSPMEVALLVPLEPSLLEEMPHAPIAQPPVQPVTKTVEPALLAMLAKGYPMEVALPVQMPPSTWPTTARPAKPATVAQPAQPQPGSVHPAMLASSLRTAPHAQPAPTTLFPQEEPKPIALHAAQNVLRVLTLMVFA